MNIIPAIDLIDGKCVRLQKGNYTTKKVYHNNPVVVAKQFEDAGIRHLHLVDLDGAKAGHIVNNRILEQIAAKTNLQIDFGGGLTSDEEVQKAFDNGASQITAGTIAVKKPELVYKWLNEYGSDKIILGADCYERKIRTNGWEEGTDIEVIQFVKEYASKGISNVICTDISKDGMLEGPSKALYLEILTGTPVKLIASGGISSLKDIHSMMDIGCDGVIIGKALYEGNIKLKDIYRLC